MRFFSVDFKLLVCGILAVFSLAGLYKLTFSEEDSSEDLSSISVNVSGIKIDFNRTLKISDQGLLCVVAVDERGSEVGTIEGYQSSGYLPPMPGSLLSASSKAFLVVSRHKIETIEVLPVWLVPCEKIASDAYLKVTGEARLAHFVSFSESTENLTRVSVRLYESSDTFTVNDEGSENGQPIKVLSSNHSSHWRTANFEYLNWYSIFLEINLPVNDDEGYLKSLSKMVD
jgi:hypothetical protein